MSAPVLEIRGLVKRYARPGLLGAWGPPPPPAVDGVDLRLEPGEVVGLIGESGSGKTTLVRAALGFLRRDGGEVRLLGHPPEALRRGRLRPLGRRVQLLLQDPSASLNPGLTVLQALRESARLHRPGGEADGLAREVARRVGLDHRLDALPRQLSGGEQRRVGIARLLLSDPLLVVADEPTAGLDAALKAEILDLLLEGRDPGRADLVISHDLPMVLHACQRLVVMYAGRVIEELAVPDVGRLEHHPYTRSLLGASGLLPPPPGPARTGTPAGRGARGCPYRGACPLAVPACAERPPALRRPPGDPPSHRVACHALCPEEP